MYAWAVPPLLAGSLAMYVLSPRRAAGDTTTLDLSLGLALAACALQIVPAPAGVIDLLSPTRARLLNAIGLVPAGSEWVTLSVAPAHSVHATLVFLSAVLVFLSAREGFAHGGVRRVCRGVAWIGLALACFAIVQSPLYTGRIYGFWAPAGTGAFPFGPFVNRNHCATWLIMAVPLTVGYMMARQREANPAAGRAARHKVRRWTIDSRTTWLALASTTMVLAVAVSLSRSGIGAGALAFTSFLALGRGRLDRGRGGWLILLVVAAMAGIATIADLGAVIERFGGGIHSGLSRVRIWRDTLPIIRDFWLTGSGTGTYETTMLFYQTGDRTYSFNQAHNHVLQVMSEGGALLVLPLVAALAAFVRLGAQRLREDASGLFWIRAGAAAGLAGVATQSLLDTGLTAPANALLAGVLGALLLHTPMPSPAAARNRHPAP